MSIETTTNKSYSKEKQFFLLKKDVHFSFDSFYLILLHWSKVDTSLYCRDTRKFTRMTEKRKKNETQKTRIPSENQRFVYKCELKSEKKEEKRKLSIHFILLFILSIHLIQMRWWCSDEQVKSIVCLHIQLKDCCSSNVRLFYFSLRIILVWTNMSIREHHQCRIMMITQRRRKRRIWSCIVLVQVQMKLIMSTRRRRRNRCHFHRQVHNVDKIHCLLRRNNANFVRLKVSLSKSVCCF